MSFFLFQLIFAVVILTLLVIGGVLLRNHLRGRPPKGSAPARTIEPMEIEPKAPKLKMPKLAKKPAEPESEAPAPVRRRQLQSFAEAEKSMNEAELAPEAVPEPVSAAEPEPFAEPAMEIPEEPAADIPAEPEPAELLPEDGEEDLGPVDPYAQAVLERLEQDFEALEHGDISLETYRGRLAMEHAAVEQRIAALENEFESDELDGALAARESVRWCINWANEQAEGAE